MSKLSAGQGTDLIAYRNLTGFNFALKAAEGVIRTGNALDGKVEAFFLPVAVHIHRFQIIQQCGTIILGKPVGFFGDVVSLCGRQRDGLDIDKAQFILQIEYQSFDLILNILKGLLAVVYQIHFIDGENEVVDTHQSTDTGMTACLHQYTLSGIDENYGQLGKRGTHCHVSRILLMSGSVCYDEGTLIGGEIAVSYVNRNALFPLGHQTVQQQRIVDFSTAGTHFTFQLESFLLVGVE